MPGMAELKRPRKSLAIAAAATVAIACGIGAWAIGHRALQHRDSSASRAYKSGQWAAAADAARHTLTVDSKNIEALRILARSSVRLGRDDSALALYRRRLGEPELEAEDYLLLGLLQERHGQPQLAARAWNKVLEGEAASPNVLEELTRLAVRGRHFDEAIRAAQELGRRRGWEARGALMLGTIRLELNNVPDAARSFQRALELDPAALDRSQDPTPLRKLIARTFLGTGHPEIARPLLQAIDSRAADPEAAWLLSRAFLQQGETAQAQAALERAGNYRALHPLDPEPGLYVGEARCQKCHPTIFQASLESRHTRTYHRGAQLDALPLPARPLPDPDDPGVTHTFRRRESTLHEETRVGTDVFDAVIEYAFGTTDRYLTTVSRDAGGHYHMSRLSYYNANEGTGWDRTTLDMTHPTRARAANFQGESIGVREGLAKCLYCHVTNPRTGQDAIGPEANDRAIGCERCHGPGGNHIAALEAGFSDSAIVNPKAASAQLVTTKQCNDCHILEHAVRDDDPENPGWVRSQGIGWSRSRCNTESGARFGCVTCHDPHQRAGATSAAAYEAKCLKCHSASGPTARPCRVNPSNGCIECHMPRVPIESLHTRLTDHYIRVKR